MANSTVSAAAWHEVRPSRMLMLGEGVLTAAATASALGLDLPLWVRALIVAGVWLVAIRALIAQRHHITALRVLSGGRLEARCSSDPVTEYHIDPATTLLGPLVVLHLSAPASKRTLTLLPDSLHHDSGRQLRVWLRWHANLVEHTRH